ncbi:unnamed protein product [Psylliodes chrysocephalus]|uniref:Regulatory protein zeste n=1 Tax=Psylliodes chrysocephalus TaxID=3402493 RepID=A0A9P0G922_9CUCU|nr:unnamed protein product [Psylliodes chrysocephala]
MVWALGKKTTAEWRRALTDWKSKTKAKAAKLRMAQEGTGGGLSTALPLTDCEKRLLSLMGNVAVEGDRGVIEFGHEIGEEEKHTVEYAQEHHAVEYAQENDHDYNKSSNSLKKKTG